jgi:hypothetical protein
MISHAPTSRPAVSPIRVCSLRIKVVKFAKGGSSMLFESPDYRPPEAVHNIEDDNPACYAIEILLPDTIY